VSQVGRAASKDEARPTLTGVLVEVNREGVTLVATDSYRLAVRELTATSAGEAQAIVPERALAEAGRAASQIDKGEIEIFLDQSQVAVRAGGLTMTSRLIEGQFPNYRQLLPEQFEHEVLLPREEALEVVRRVSLMAQRNSPLRLRFADGELTVSAVTQDVGEARESLPAPYTAEPLEIGFNAEFLRDGLDSVDSDTVKFKLISPLRPAVLEGESDDYVYLIMPIRLAG
jgi:DNA polymerase-3 subunit beta